MTLSAMKTERTKGTSRRMAPYDPPHNQVKVRKHVKHGTGKTVTVGLSRLRPAVHSSGTATSTHPNRMNTSTNQYKYDKASDTYWG